MVDPAGVQKMEDILEVQKTKNIDKISKNTESISKHLDVTPRGKPKSGKIWKSEKKKFSSIIKTKGIRRSFNQKQELKAKLKHVKELSDSIKATKQAEKEMKKQRRRENLKRQQENQKKSEIVQVITNTKKLKKMKKKQLRMIEKRDTTVVAK
ncbi:unnamed protein product [Acanthoscelides obtectus]|uniref:Coiled-coil domain-containing protein 86 n=1 Tax=Acanthoscelides obtectus TaxID=200917 RepID=A0A9P0P9L9_ACAOB|nr:unnamed protein product [Acanthoscelides obtectus]CAH1975937.1 unnamed protein product [Acanthoscelides obtectus]CAK1667707.1 Coiled-coil domain-containing protein 86 [Acanthoscelides obtectus]CAK1667709.1 Coiled-coil domain-containing protein 86 [Acanthoscelides obtectus]